MIINISADTLFLPDEMMIPYLSQDIQKK